MLPTSVIMATLFATMMSIGLWRKAVLRTATLGNNGASFVNQTAKRLHIRKVIVRAMNGGSATVLGDIAQCSLDEVPVIQMTTDDSRSHIAGTQCANVGGTGAIAMLTDREVLNFGRNDLVLDPDEALFLNTADVQGAPSFSGQAQIFYED